MPEGEQCSGMESTVAARWRTEAGSWNSIVSWAWVRYWSLEDRLCLP